MATHPNGDDDDDDETERHEVDPAPSPFDTAQDTSDFSQERKEMAAELDSRLPEYMADRFGVPAEDVHSVDELTEKRYERSDAFRLAQVIDFTGIDRIVDEKDRVFGVGCRVRPEDEEYDDFSLRADNGVDGLGSEYDNILNAYERGGILPTYYLYGIYNESHEFVEVHLIEVRKMITEIKMGNVDLTPPIQVRDGKAKARFIPVDELRSTDCIDRSWPPADAEADTTE